MLLALAAASLILSSSTVLMPDDTRRHSRGNGTAWAHAWGKRSEGRAQHASEACEYRKTAPLVPLVRHHPFPMLSARPQSGYHDSRPINITVIIAHCQEDLSWVRCWHPAVTRVIIYEKCSALHPGFAHGSMLRTAAALPLSTGPCIGIAVASPRPVLKEGAQARRSYLSRACALHVRTGEATERGST